MTSKLAVVNRCSYRAICYRAPAFADDKAMNKPTSTSAPAAAAPPSPEDPRISREEVVRIADLARLALSESEVDDMREQLGRILDSLAELNRLDATQAQPPTYHAVSLTAQLREDEPIACLSHEDALRAAPRKEEGTFVATVAIPSAARDGKP